LRVGLDYRPALVNREGIGRYARELVRALVELSFDASLGLFGYTLAAMRYSRAELGIAGSRAELVRLRMPSRFLPALLRRTKKGVDDLVGGCAVYHHTQPNRLHVRAAEEVATIFDCIYTIDADERTQAGYLEPETARRMTAVARELVSHARKILVPSRFVGAEVVMSLGAKPSDVIVTPLGCDHVVRTLPPGGLPRAKEPYILTVARVDPRKNHARMLEAYELLVREGLPHRWLIAGPRGWRSEDFERALARSPVAKRVEWRTEVPESALAALYAGADLLLWPSLNEGFGLPPLESMACGTPVVTSIVTSMPEICGDAALLVEPTSSAEIFEAARGLLTDRDLHEEHVLRGKRRAREFTWTDCARRTLHAYQAATSPTQDQPKPSPLF
jgi:glycosyltransferase involved in cell wall biosynthesis